MDEDEEETVADIMKVIASGLQQVKKLCTRCSLKLLTHLTAVSQYVKLREKHRKHPNCSRPAMSASLKVARRMGKGPYFARQIRENEWHLLKHVYLPISKTEKQNGHHTLLDNEQVRIGVRRYLAAQDLGTISPQDMVKHLRSILFPALGYSGKDAGINNNTARNWLHMLGYEYMGQAQAAYHDGHEQKPVVAR